MIVHKTLSCSSWVSTPVASSLFCTMYSWAGKQKLKGKGSLSVAKTFQFERGVQSFPIPSIIINIAMIGQGRIFFTESFSPSVRSPFHLAILVVTFV